MKYGDLESDNPNQICILFSEFFTSVSEPSRHGEGYYESITMNKDCFYFTSFRLFKRTQKIGCY